jgi:pimeloyl-ACP methyl ester carboxylesterase
VQPDASKAAGVAMGLQILVLNASNDREVNTAFATLVEHRIGALAIGQDTFFTSQPAQLAVLTERHGIPASSPWREHVEAGLLMSYGASIKDAYRQSGVYAGKVLKGLPCDPRATSVRDIDAFEQFAAFNQDAKDNRIFAEKKLTMPILALGAEKSFGDQQAAILREVATNVQGGIITGSGHWIMEEQPAQTVSMVRAFLDGK